MKAPFPYFGGKRRVAHVVWERFGDVPNYVEPFAGSLAVLLARPHEPRAETVNDLDCYLANFWRALARDPDEVARWTDAPVNEADLYARHLWLVNRAEFREHMKTDPDFCDAKIAGWWVWGISQWIGSGWCVAPQQRGRFNSHLPKGVHAKRCQLKRGGAGVHRSALRESIAATTGNQQPTRRSCLPPPRNHGAESDATPVVDGPGDQWSRGRLR